MSASIASSQLYLGVDVGKSKISSGLIDVSTNTLIKRSEISSSGCKGDEILLKVDELIEAAVSDWKIEGVGIGCFGIIEKSTGNIASSGSISNWNNIDLYKRIKTKFNIQKIVIENDANAAAAGEYYINYANNDIVLITQGTDIGLGAIINGKIYRGRHNLCGEIAHLHITNQDFTFSEICGGRGIANRYENRSGVKLTASEIVELAMYQHNILASDIINDVINSLTTAIFLVQNLIDPDIILIGGSVAIKNPEFFKRLSASVNTQYPSTYLKSCGGIKLSLASLGVDSGIWGGVALCIGAV